MNKRTHRTQTRTFADDGSGVALRWVMTVPVRLLVIDITDPERRLSKRGNLNGSRDTSCNPYKRTTQKKTHTQSDTRRSAGGRVATFAQKTEFGTVYTCFCVLANEGSWRLTTVPVRLLVIDITDPERFLSKRGNFNGSRDTLCSP